MADVTSTVTARLRVENGQWLAAMAQAGKAAQDAAKQTEKAGKAADKAFSGAGADKAVAAQGKIGSAATAAGTAAAAAGTKAATGSQAMVTGAGRAATAYTTLGAKAKASFQGLSNLTDQQVSALSDLSGSALKAGAVLAIPAAAGVKAAMDWESAFTGVKKTVDGTPEQLAQVEAGLRGLAKTLPATHQEIAAVAENAGQLGVARKDIIGFTKTMVDLGESTNLTADEAATNIAQISNVMGTMGREGSEGVSRFGATLVELGNNGASTEKEIVNMAQRMAGAVKTVGGNEPQLLALSNTLASMGIRAELGGGVATRVLLKMSSAVDDGGDKLQAFAETAGMSADEFAAKFKASPIEALDAVSKGLHGVNEAGGNVTATLSDLGMKGTEEKQVMLALASSGDLLTQSLKQGADAWRDNSALTEEATKRYATAESKIKVAWNNIKDAGIDVGASLLPAVAGIAEGISGLVQAFSGLPGPVKGALGVITGFGGAALLAVGGLGKIIGSINNFKTAWSGFAGPMRTASGSMDGVSKKSGMLAKSMSAIGKAAGGVTIAAGALALVGHAITDKAVKGTEDLANAVLKLGNSGDASSLNDMFNAWDTQAFQATNKDVTDLDSAVRKLMNPPDGQAINKWADNTFAWTGLAKSGVTQTEERFKSLSDTMGQMVSGGNADQAAATFQKIADSFEAQGGSAQDALNVLPGYAQALQQQSQDAGAALEGQELLSAAMDGIAPAAQAAQAQMEAAQGAASGMGDASGAAGESMAALGQEAKTAAQAIDEAVQAMQAAQDAVIAAENAELGYQASLDATAAAIKANGANLDVTTEKGRANKQALLEQAQASMAYALAADNIPDTASRMQASRDAFISSAQAMGMGAVEAAKYADSLGLVPDKVYTEMALNSGDLETKLATIHELVQANPKGTVTISDNSPEVIAGLEALGYKVKVLPNGKIEVTDGGTAAATGKKADAAANKKRTAKINAEAITGAANSALEATAKQRATQIIASAVDHASSVLNSIARPRTAVINVTTFRKTIEQGSGNGFGVLRANGGTLPKHAAGYRLPTTGPGTDRTDGITAVDRKGIPVAMVDRGEWVINRRTSERHDGFLRALNANDPRAVQAASLSGFATGGRLNWSRQDQGKASASSRAAAARVKQAQAAVKAAEKWSDKANDLYSDAPGDKKNKSRKKFLKNQAETGKRRLAAAQSRLKKAEAAADKASKRYDDAKSRSSELYKTEFDFRRDVKRGTIRDQFKSGSGMSVVDKMFDWSNDENLSKGQRSNLRTKAYSMEKAMLSLEKRADSLKDKLSAATEKRDDLLQARNSVKSAVTGSFDLGGLTGQKDGWGYSKSLNKASISKYGRSMAAGAKQLEGKLRELAKRGFPPSILDEVIDEWTGGQTFELANALMSMNLGERQAFQRDVKSFDTWAERSGDRVTDAMSGGAYKSGLYAAQGVVKGLESQSKAVDKAFYNLGLTAENAFKRALGIKSPSRVMMANAGHTVDGLVKGLGAGAPKAATAMASLGDDVSRAYQAAINGPSARVPASAEVARYAASQGQPAVIDYDRLADAVAVRTVNLVVDGKQAGNLVDAGQRHARKNR